MTPVSAPEVVMMLIKFWGLAGPELNPIVGVREWCEIAAKSPVSRSRHSRNHD